MTSVSPTPNPAPAGIPRGWSLIGSAGLLFGFSVLGFTPAWDLLTQDVAAIGGLNQVGFTAVFTLLGLVAAIAGLWQIVVDAVPEN